jgi:Predicted nucleoside-diphosphate sugar epimerases
MFVKRQYSNGVKRVVALSTDKAVETHQCDGSVKEYDGKDRILQNQQAMDTVFSCVRYGNVMGSRGSVIPFFRKLIQEKSH